MVHGVQSDLTKSGFDFLLRLGRDWRSPKKAAGLLAARNETSEEAFEEQVVELVWPFPGAHGRSDIWTETGEGLNLPCDWSERKTLFWVR